MADRDTTKRMFTHMINMMEQHDTMTISCGDPLMELLKDVRELLKEQPEIVPCKDCKHKEESVSPSWEAWCNRLHCGCDNDWFCADGERSDGDE